VHSDHTSPPRRGRRAERVAAVALAFVAWLIALAGVRTCLVCGLGHPVYSVDEGCEFASVACAVAAAAVLLVSRR
jgi:hypothetical protein